MRFQAFLLVVGLGLSCLSLNGCGQKGPLYLPSEQPEQGSVDRAPAAANPEAAATAP